jgi:hypothetical protein
MLNYFIMQASNSVAQTGSPVDIPSFLWKDAPILAILALVIFWQGKKLDNVVQATSGLAGEIRGLIETLRTLMVKK